MKRRSFINKAGIVTVGVASIPLIACKDTSKMAESASKMSDNSFTEFSLPDLPYAKDALAPNIDAQTMGIHHDKHHAGYVRKLNNALKDHNLAGSSLEEICMNVGDKDADLGVRNNGGGHYNHSLFWEVMTPGGSELPKGELAKAINSSFGSFEDMQGAFSKAAGSVFGSGWAWLVADSDKKLFISSTANQDNPLMKNIIDEPGTPILGIDVWEHAYYLNYQNMRSNYIKNFMKIVNWDKVSENYSKIS